VFTFSTYFYIFSNLSKILSKASSPETPNIPETYDNKGPNFSFKTIAFSKPFSIIFGKLSNLKVCPVGAVSKTITSYF